MSQFHRRRFLQQSAAVSSGLFLRPSDVFAAATHDAVPVRVRIDDAPLVCLAPQYLAREMLRMERQVEVEFVDIGDMSIRDALAAGQVDFTLLDAASVVLAMDVLPDLRVLGGVHAGCWELVAHKGINAIRDLRGRRIVVRAKGEVEHAWIAGALAYVGINPLSEVEWLEVGRADEVVRVFSAGQADACLLTPPRDQVLRDKGIGHVLVNAMEDRPWSQYYCCLLVSTRQVLERHPSTVKRFMRAIFRAADLCTQDPSAAAGRLAHLPWMANQGEAVRVLKNLRYDRWRSDSSSDSLRFYGLRFHDVGMIRTHPNQLIARGLDLRFLDELRRELKS